MGIQHESALVFGTNRKRNSSSSSASSPITKEHQTIKKTLEPHRHRYRQQIL